ncbi:MAG: phosphopantetheine-binding protein [Deltaproteobacteria bacterium]|jgi:acyl carrier protein|nr:phosphopantetheine-binding protein [Deltaproteobacteria bacterium]
MNPLQVYTEIFAAAFGLSQKEAAETNLENLAAWDSLAHLALIAALDDAFGIHIGVKDMTALRSFANGLEILRKYGIAV